MGDSYYPAAYGGGQLDFSGIQRAAAGLAKGLFGDDEDGVHGTPIWGKDPVTGKEVLGVITRDGNFKRLDTGGVDVQRGVTIEDLGYGRAPVSKGDGSLAGPVIQQTGDLPAGYVPPPNYQPVPPPSGYAPATRPGELDVYGAPPQDRSAGAPGQLPPGYATSAAQPPPQAGAYMPGTEQARTEAEAAKKIATQQQQGDLGLGVVSEDVKRAKALIASDPFFPATGFFGGMTQNVPGTPAHDLQQLLEPIGSSVSLERLQQLRQASPTGASLGNVSNMDLQTVRTAYGSLLQSQTKDQLVHNLDRFERVYAEIVNGPGYSRDGTTQQPQVRGWQEFFGAR
jgi:hypothetical protein